MHVNESAKGNEGGTERPKMNMHFKNYQYFTNHEKCVKNIGEKTISVFRWTRMEIFNWLLKELWIMQVHVLILLQRVKLILHTYIISWYVMFICIWDATIRYCLFYFYLNLVCCFVCEVQSSDIVSSVCQTVNIDCAIND